MKSNCFTSRLGSCRVWFATLFMTMFMVAGAFAQTIGLAVSSTDATACGAADGTITISTAGTVLPVGYSSFGRVERVSPAGPAAATFTGSGTVTGLGAGTYTVTWQVFETATGLVFDVRTAAVVIRVAYNPAVNGISCIGGSASSPGLNVTLGANCSSTLRASQVILAQCADQINDADYTVTIKTLGGNVISTTGALNAALIGQTVQAEVMHTASGVKCWGFVKIEDKTNPVVTPPSDITINCAQLSTDGSLPKENVLGELAIGSLGRNPFFTPQTTRNSSVADCSKWDQSYIDNVVYTSNCVPTTAATVTSTDGTNRTVAVPANTIRIVERLWRAKDIWGNLSAPRSQFIFVVRPTGTIRVDNYTATCVGFNANSAPAPYIDVNNNGVFNAGTDISLATAVCGVSAEIVRVETVNICTGTTKFVRTWKVTDICGNNPAANNAAMVVYLEQVLTSQDLTPPTMTASYITYSLKKEVAYQREPFGMTCMNDTYNRLIRMDVNNAAVGTTIDITPLADNNMCGAAFVSLNLTAQDLNCGNGKVTLVSSDSRVKFSNGMNNIQVDGGQTVTLSGFVMTASGIAGTVSFRVTATDDCGNVFTTTVNVNIVDNVAANLNCKEEIRTSLNTQGQARLTAVSFDNGAKDNCGIKWIYARRMGTTCWKEFVDFDCNDCGKTDLMVELLVIDENDNANICMVNVTVDDKTAPTCMSPANITIDCNDPRLNAGTTGLNALFARPAAWDNCGIVRTDSTTTPSLATFTLKCGRGEVTRSWTFTDKVGLSATCSQRITVAPVYGFRVPRLADENLTCAYAFDTTAERNRIINGLRLLNTGGANTCSAPVVEVEYWKFQSSQYCQIYRIRYTIIDFCNPRFNYGGPQVGTSIAGNLIQDDNGVVVYERFVYVDDRTAPVSTPPARRLICDTQAGDTDADACEFGFSTTITGSDNCGAGTAASSPANLYFTWRLVDAAGVQITSGAGNATATGFTVSRTNLAFGTYTVYYRVSDLCGNTSVEYSFEVEGRDCKVPTINVHDKIVALGGIFNTPSSSMGMLTIADIANDVNDDCTPKAFLISKYTLQRGGRDITVPYPSGPAVSTLAFTCADLANTDGTYAKSRNFEVRLWTIDLANNANFAVSTITVQDNDGICAGNASFSTLAGTTGTEDNKTVANVTVTATNPTLGAVTATTAANGTYSIGNLSIGQTYQVKATSTNDKNNGVTSFDIALISRHLLGIQGLNSAYKVIAADVDKSGEVDASDMLHLRRFILQITPNLPGGVWRFVDKSYSFRNAANPFAEDFREVVSLSNIPAAAAANFVAVKLGDVNNSFDPALTQPRGAKTLSFSTEDMNIVAGNEYTVTVKAENFNAAAFQGTLSFEGANVKSVKAGNFANMSDANFGQFASAVTMSWNGEAGKEGDVATITFIATKSGKLSEMLTLGSELTRAEANDANGNVMNVNLKFNSGKVSGGEFALYQNQPNPVEVSTKIGFNLPSETTAKLTVYTVEGKVLFTQSVQGKAGYNEVIVNKAQLNASGVVLYRLETAENAATKKMIIME